MNFHFVIHIDLGFGHSIEIINFLKYDSYAFRVSVYDAGRNSWSEFSDESDTVNNSISYSLKFKNSTVKLINS